MAAAATAQQVDGEGRRTGRVRLQRPAGGGAHRPARGGGAGHGVGIDPEQQGRDARRLAGELEATAGGEVEKAGAAPQLDHRDAEVRAVQGIRAGPQHRPGIGHDAEQQPGGVETQLRQPRPVEPPLPLGRRLAQPQHRAAQPMGEDGAETGRARRIGAGGGEQLVQSAAPDAAAKDRVHPLMTRRHRAPLRGRGVLAGTGQLAQGRGGGAGFGHMFTFCSYQTTAFRIKRSGARAQALRRPARGGIAGPTVQRGPMELRRPRRTLLVGQGGAGAGSWRRR